MRVFCNMNTQDLSFRPTIPEDAPYLFKWLSDPRILTWFPMFDAREIEDAVRIWVGYSKIEAGLTALWNSEPCGMANLYIQPYKKLAHTCLFSIIVKEEMRGKGVGKQLLEHLMKHAKEKFKIEILHLEVYQEIPLSTSMRGRDLKNSAARHASSKRMGNTSQKFSCKNTYDFGGL